LASRPRSRSNSKPKVMPVPEQIEKYMWKRHLNEEMK
jgi:hypothetical protein